METLIDLAQIILLLSAAALCIFLILYVGKITKSITEIQKELNKMTQEINPLIESLESLSKTVTSLSDDIRSQLGKVSWVFDEVKSKIEAVVHFQDRIRDKFDYPAQNLVGNLEAIKNGVSAFWHSFRRKN